MTKKPAQIQTAAKYICIQEGERVLIIDPVSGGLAHALAEKHPTSRFFLYNPDVETRRSFVADRQSPRGIDNVGVLTDSQLEEMQRSARSIDVVVLQPKTFVASVLVKRQMLMGARVLKPYGRFYLVTHKRSGASNHQENLTELVGTNALIVGRGGGGYRILEASKDPNAALPMGLNLREEVSFSILGIEFHLESEPSLFSQDQLDIGTRFLLVNVDLYHFERMLDLGCGWGAIGLVAATANPTGEVVMVDIDRRATSVASDNVRRLGLQDRVLVVTADSVEQTEGTFDLILSNPPFHADGRVLTSLFRAAHEKLRMEGSIFVVVENTYVPRFTRVLGGVFASSRMHCEDKVVNYSIIAAKK